MSSRHPWPPVQVQTLGARPGREVFVHMSEPIDSTGAGEGLTELRRSLGGAVLVPADAGFDAARRSFNTLVDRRPAVIVRCLDAGDVAKAF